MNTIVTYAEWVEYWSLSEQQKHLAELALRSNAVQIMDRTLISMLEKTGMVAGYMIGVTAQTSDGKVVESKTRRSGSSIELFDTVTNGDLHPTLDAKLYIRNVMHFPSVTMSYEIDPSSFQPVTLDRPVMSDPMWMISYAISQS